MLIRLNRHMLHPQTGRQTHDQEKEETRIYTHKVPQLQNSLRLRVFVVKTGYGAFNTKRQRREESLRRTFSRKFCQARSTMLRRSEERRVGKGGRCRVTQ